MFTQNTSVYNITEPLDIRIERICPRPYFIVAYAINPDMLVLGLCNFMADQYGADKEFGDNYVDAVRLAVDEIMKRTHLSESEWKIFSAELKGKVFDLVSQKSAGKKVKSMTW